LRLLAGVALSFPAVLGTITGAASPQQALQKELVLKSNIAILLLFLLSSACAPAAQGPEAAATAYIQALVAGETDQLVNLSCAAWEEGARNELASFTAVEVSVQDVGCQSSNLQDDSAQVVCEGKIVANYGNEILEINLADRSYQMIKEGGEWRMCGYQ
jgi:hypothetical protein